MTCTHCTELIDGPHLADDATGEAFHPACLVERVPQDAARLVAELLAVVLVPTVLRWAA